MAGQMAEQVAPQIAGHADKGEIRDPASDAPQKIVSGDQRAEQDERRPDAGGVVIGKHVDQNFTPYCVPTEQVTAPSTAARMTACETGRSRT